MKCKDEMNMNLELFWSKVDKSGGCWIWTGTRSTKGYGRFAANRALYQAHRIAYEQIKGPIPSGLVLDHICRVRHCVNPAHLEPVTNRENLMRGIGITAQAAKKTHCPQGHPYSGNNLHIAPTGDRKCKQCARDYRSRAYWEKKNANSIRV